MNYFFIILLILRFSFSLLKAEKMRISREIESLKQKITGIDNERIDLTSKINDKNLLQKPSINDILTKRLQINSLKNEICNLTNELRIVEEKIASANKHSYK